jgi:type IV pilus assembly protein PilN
MRISLNLATRPYADIGPALKRLRIAMVVLVVIGLALGLGLRATHQQAEEARATEQVVQGKIDAINQERQGYQDLMRQPANDTLLKQVAALNQLFDEKTFSWTLAMEDLETVLPSGVQASTLEPVRDPKTGIITLKLRVVGPRDRAVDLVENLEHSKHFLLPTIVGESTESTGGPGEKVEPPSASNRVNFELLAQYNPTVPMDRKTQKKQENEKPSAGVERARHSVPPPPVAHSAQPPAAQVPAVPAQKTIQPPTPAPGLHRLNRSSLNPYPHSNPNQKPNPNPVLNPKPNLQPGGPR